ncbi:hypothetical protein MHYP_G00010700 [Metynnis hypsauchen]
MQVVEELIRKLVVPEVRGQRLDFALGVAVAVRNKLSDIQPKALIDLLKAGTEICIMFESVLGFEPATFIP